MRYREDKPEDLDRARAAVAAWREQNPAGTEDQLLAALGPTRAAPMKVSCATLIASGSSLGAGMDTCLAAAIVGCGTARCFLGMLNKAPFRF